MITGVFPEWLNVNAGRAFPLAENSSRTDSTGSVTLPNSLLVAAQISFTPSYVGGTFYLSEVFATPDTVGLKVSFLAPDASIRDVARVNVAVAQHFDGRSYAWVGSGQDTAVLGSFTIGNLDDTLGAIPGQVTFEPGATSFEVSALFISSPVVEAIEIYNGPTLLKRYTEILKLRAGENIRLSYVDDDPDVIRIDAIAGENLIQPNACENAVPLPPCIRTINGQPADDHGNFDIDGGACIDVETSPGLITLKDLCSQSCCGCTELAELMAGLTSIESQLDQLREQVRGTITQQGEMISNLIANLR